MTCSDDDDYYDDDKPSSPRPWSLNPRYPDGGGMGQMPSPILDANGREVLHLSEWLSARQADIEMIIRAVNALDKTETAERLMVPLKFVPVAFAIGMAISAWT